MHHQRKQFLLSPPCACLKAVFSCHWNLLRTHSMCGKPERTTFFQKHLLGRGQWKLTWPYTAPCLEMEWPGDLTSHWPWAWQKPAPVTPNGNLRMTVPRGFFLSLSVGLEMSPCINYSNPGLWSVSGTIHIKSSCTTLSGFVKLTCILHINPRVLRLPRKLG